MKENTGLYCTSENTKVPLLMYLNQKTKGRVLEVNYLHEVDFVQRTTSYDF